MNARFLAASASVAFCVLAGCNQSSTSTSSAEPGNNPTIAAVKDAGLGAVGKIDAAITTSAQGFVTAAATSDMYEVQAANIALTRSHSDAVKKFAQAMIDAHTKTTADLKALIAANSIQVTLPAALDDTHNALISDLNGAKDEDFDTRYIKQQEAAHSDAVTLFQTYADKGDNDQLKEFASSTEPTIQMHLDMARAMDPSNNASKS